MYQLHARDASASEAGDYFQVSFHENRSEGEEEDGRYFLVQRQFEFPDGDRCAIETEVVAMSGHFRIRQEVLERGRLRVSWLGRVESQAEVTFEADDESYADILRVLTIMVPMLEVRQHGGTG